MVLFMPYPCPVSSTKSFQILANPFCAHKSLGPAPDDLIRPRMCRVPLATVTPEKTTLRPELEGAGGAAHADEAVDGMNVFSELIDVLGIIRGKRPGSGEKLERAARADHGVS